MNRPYNDDSKHVDDVGGGLQTRLYNDGIVNGIDDSRHFLGRGRFETCPYDDDSNQIDELGRVTIVGQSR